VVDQAVIPILEVFEHLPGGQSEPEKLGFHQQITSHHGDWDRKIGFIFGL
jgi:hypothetical protein